MEYTDEILEIARFMGMNPIKGVNDRGDIYYYYNNSEMQDYEGLPFFDTWNDLMPVVEKIESFGGDDNEFDIFGNCVQIGGKEVIGNTKKEAVRDALVWWIRNKNEK